MLLFFCRYNLCRLFLTDNALCWPDKSTHQKQNVKAGVYPEHTSSCRRHQWWVCWAPVWQCIPGRPCSSEATGVMPPLWPTVLLQYVITIAAVVFETVNVCAFEFKTSFLPESPAILKYQYQYLVHWNVILMWHEPWGSSSQPQDFLKCPKF